MRAGVSDQNRYLSRAPIVICLMRGRGAGLAWDSACTTIVDSLPTTDPAIRWRVCAAITEGTPQG